MPDHVLLKVIAAGINFADIMQHQGTYPLQLPLPYTPGMEVVGIVEDIGAEVTNVRLGERVAAISFAGGGYAEYIAIKPEQLIRIPDTLDAHIVLALLIQGVSAYLLLDYAAKIRGGESVLIHAAAGGVGNLLVQLAKLMNAGDVFATAGTIAKREVLRKWGVDYPIDYSEPNWYETVMNITSGKGIDIILDPVGGSAITQNLSCLGIEGRFVSYGWLSGSCPSLTATQCQSLLFKNQSVSGFAVNVVMDRHPDVVAAALTQLFTWVQMDKLRPILGHVFSLKDATQAHTAISTRQTTGKVILQVDRYHA
ncbi:MAG: NADPH:quinone oxidoreductase family protein [Methylacidiphilales bacterium]|nr:NADPH:quinone oxidoreductase family protein [Candidatus Methylacidiphilales bacterium]